MTDSATTVRQFELVTDFGTVKVEPPIRHTRPHGRGFAGRQRPKTMTTLFGPTAQTRRLRQPRPAAAEAADQNIQFSSKSERWGR